MAMWRYLFFLYILLAATIGAAAEPIAPALQPMHALNRLAFGPAPGDLERVGRIGVARYIEEQLHPAAIPLPEGLTQKLGQLSTLELDIVVMSEFGRTVRENGNGGTDHGHGNVMWVMGGPVRGGKIYGDWRGLAADQLHEGRDLPVTTDFRAIYARILGTHLELSAAQLDAVFPRFRHDGSMLSGLMA